MLGPGWIAGPGIDLLRENPRLGRRLRKRGRRIHVWTVNTAADLDLCCRAGVEAVITDHPGMALDHYRDTGGYGAVVHRRDPVHAVPRVVPDAPGTIGYS